MNNQNSQKKDNFSDIKKIFNKALRSWYLFLIALVIAFTTAYYINKYTQSIYHVSSTVLIKGKSAQSSAAQFLYGSDIAAAGGGEGVESIILQSYPIIKQTITELDFTQQLFVDQEVGPVDLYGKEPAIIEIDSVSKRSFYGSRFIFTIVDEGQFRFYNKNEQDQQYLNKLYEFDKTTDYKGFVFKVRKRNNFNLNDSKDKEHTLVLTHPHNVTMTYTNRLRVKAATPDGSVLEISINGPNIRKEVNFLYKLIEVYRQDELKRKNEIATKTVDFIDDRLRKITDSLYHIEQKKEAYKRRNKSAQMSQSVASLYNRLQDVEDEKVSIESQLNIYSTILNIVNGSGEIGDLTGLRPLIKDNNLQKLIGDIVNEQSKIERATQGQQSVSANPLIGIARDNIDRLKGNIRETVNILNGSITSRYNDVSRRVSRIEGEIYTIPQAERELVDIERLNKISEGLYLLYNQKKAEAEVAKASASNDIQLIDPPMNIGGAITDQDKRNFLVALFLGLTIPLGLIILRDFFNTKISSKEELNDLTQIPQLGMVWKNAKTKDMLTVSKNPKSIVAESFRSLRSNLNFFTADINNKVFVLTSSISGEGKTFCSINLSTVFAFASKKTLLIGADLRRPKIFDDFGLKNDIGLSNYLAGSAFKSEIIQRTEIPNLDIISSGPVPPNPSELLMTPKMGDLIKELKEEYEYIVIDTAPLGLVTDAFILMNHADHTIFLTRQNYTPIEAVKNAQELYQSGKLKKVSLLFNDVKTQANGYKYGYGQGYYAESNGKSN
ncbi:polysaccharide biosynthesis tyrosine autokinase [Fulvivirgaceae bacterium BMA10]|uniref:non-specific protein-tyrosine kinase n=1 Tax=Splendidivirga corallicola TaxID=3051826 RepID=A0ABT8KUG6_9BACT|nr:polysaccharide biosynthesis tyrosine autokinase [Fulvivirgaceae bacterium BMA10]